MPPSWQYFWHLRQADETIPDPKGREFWTPLPFSLSSSAMMVVS
jgi:hypothetical protein